jgi:hypothetical protein
MGWCENEICSPRSAPNIPAPGDRAKKCQDDETLLYNINQATPAEVYGVVKQNTVSDALKKGAMKKICDLATGNIQNSDDSSFINRSLEGTASQIGLKADGSLVVSTVADCPISKIDVGTKLIKTKKYTDGYGECNISSTDLFCANMDYTKSYIVLEETDSTYTVKGNKLLYRIIITTEYTAPSQPQSGQLCNTYEDNTCKEHSSVKTCSLV